ncbi:Sua5/YciO/YrdC/YwlC family protein [Emticicia oligotrophica DSM 17448]|uniref:Threonylcarbamoyl-AMP synthase n=1 Tax=Emticicia oligotrophica (strain DSM 17448 / CIP 109782 / MTCC 6937 / GPTSA100-15) TaxID=929562 RepID=A0ABM5N616_EMTOG|nr:L-threonylcarbamoyladenylate synthase [Emticicia oligotrophica]AFK04883.1 Sua5/YciO/YrdC/YwlC family protein [Emticicia oligotrophica DSM 17448]
MAIIGKNIDKAIEVLNSGEVIGLPTETVYGLAGNAYNTEAVTKIFSVKNRPNFDPLIVHTSSIERINEFVTEIPEMALKLANKFMPGPLTLLLPKKENISDLVTSGLPTVAVRIPNHPLAIELLEGINFPLAAPSANPFGYISPTTAQHVDNQLGTKIQYILDGGECNVGIESSIVGFFENEVVVLRKGGLAIEEIEAIVGPIKINEHSSSNPQAPGMLKSHYAPRTPLSFWGEKSFSIKDFSNTGFLAFRDYNHVIPKENQLVLSEKGDLNEAAKNLFAYMRLLDSKGFSEIFTELLPEIGLGRAINDRIKRATTQE